MSIIHKIKKKVSKISREKKLQHFYSLCKEGETVLDVGVSAESKSNLPSPNYFLKNFHYEPRTYTGLGIDDLTGMKDLYPGKSFVQYSGGTFPFPDNAFDWVFSNAVIERVGDDEAQILFVNELTRVAKNVFFTTPNKYFPLESHTNTLFLHWNDNLYHMWCKKRKPWTNENSVSLFSYHRLLNLMEISRAHSYSIIKNRFFGIPMTFTIVCTNK